MVLSCLSLAHSPYQLAPAHEAFLVDPIFTLGKHIEFVVFCQQLDPY